MNTDHQKKAVIYSRCAGGSESSLALAFIEQEQLCKAVAGVKNYQVLEVFRDHGSGTSADRPGLDAMLEFLREDRAGSISVIVQDVSRLARSVAVLTALREQFGPSRELIEATGSDGTRAPLYDRRPS